MGTFLSESQKEDLGRLKGSHDRLVDHWQRKIRFVRAVKLHMTWLFLGDVEPSRVEGILERLAELSQRHGPSAVFYDRAEIWPSARRPRQVVLTPSVVPEAVRVLGSAVRSALAGTVARPDKHDFRPHITLMRLEPPAKRQSEHIQIPDWLGLDALLPMTHEITTMSLIESHLGAGQEGYVPLKTYPLSGA